MTLRLWLNDRGQFLITCAKWNVQRKHWEAGNDTEIFGKDYFKDRMEYSTEKDLTQ